VIPLVFIALGIAALAAYELSPKARGWVNEHVRAFDDAIVAHKAADAHLESAVTSTSTPPWSPQHQVKQAWDAIQHAHAAHVANQVAAQKTADMAKTAQTEQQRQTAAQSAAAVEDRQTKIATTLQQLGIGQCGVRVYPKVSARIKDALLARLKSEGMSVSGSNPWEINTHQPDLPFISDVMLRALWDATTETLHLIVTSGKGAVVTCDEIWKRIDPILKGTIGA